MTGPVKRAMAGKLLILPAFQQATAGTEALMQAERNLPADPRYEGNRLQSRQLPIKAARTAP